MCTFHRTNKAGEVWRCNNRSECNVTVTISRNHEDVIKEPKNHENHSRDWGRVQAKECIEKMKTRAQNSREPTSSIVQREVAQISSEANMKLPKKSSIKKRIQEVRRGILPEEPKNLSAMGSIASKYTKTISGQRWLLYFDPDTTEKMAIFSTDRHLKFLQKAKYRVMDGTFQSAPDIFTQLYAIHVEVKGQWFPVVLGLMERKTKASYLTLFRILKREVNERFNRQLAPQYISTDYEQAAINAAESSFPSAVICGCLFHLGQSFWRRMQSEGLMEQYQDEDSVELRTQFRSLIALAFVPEDDVVGAFDRLKEDMVEILEPIFNYVEDNYVRGRRRGRGHMAPMFPPSKWSCYERTLGDQPRTTNSCEAWHRRLNTLVRRPHPSLYHVLQHLQEEVAEIDADIERLEGGHSPPKKKRKYVEVDKRVSRIVDSYDDYKDEGDVTRYLAAIGHAIAGQY